jgi:hypothetical protein
MDSSEILCWGHVITPAEEELRRFSQNSLSCKNLVHDVEYGSHCHYSFQWNIYQDGVMFN